VTLHGSSRRVLHPHGGWNVPTSRLFGRRPSNTGQRDWASRGGRHGMAYSSLSTTPVSVPLSTPPSLRLQVRKEADKAKEKIQIFLADWKDNSAVSSETSYTAITGSLRPRRLMHAPMTPVFSIPWVSCPFHGRRRDVGRGTPCCRFLSLGSLPILTTHLSPCGGYAAGGDESFASHRDVRRGHG
jgi:hypothetical protein